MKWGGKCVGDAWEEWEGEVEGGYDLHVSICPRINKNIPFEKKET